MGDEGAGGLPKGLLRIDPTTTTGTAFLPLTDAQAGDSFFNVSDAALWLAGSGEIDRVDIATNKIDSTYHLPFGRLRTGVAYGSVWIRNYDMLVVERLDVQP